MSNKILIIIMLLAVSSLAGVAAASSISFDPSTVTLAPGSTTQVTIRLSDAPGGLAGYELKLNYPSSYVAVTDASFPSWAGLNRKSSVSGGYLLSGVDLNKQVQSGATNIALGTVTLEGVASGTATMSISGIQMNADDGTVMSPDSGTLSVTVSGDVTAAPTTAVTTTETTVVTTGPTATTTTSTTTATTTTTTATTTAVTTAETTAAVVTVTPVIPGAPTTGFSASTVAGTVPLTVHFTDRSSGSPTSFEWDFGDGGSSMTENPDYTYQNAGTYTVSLTATNTVGSTTSTRAGFIRVLKPGETLPVTSTPTLAATQATGTTQSQPTATSSWKPTVSKTRKAAPDLAVTLLAAGTVLAGVAFFVRKRDP